MESKERSKDYYAKFSMWLGCYEKNPNHMIITWKGALFRHIKKNMDGHHLLECLSDSCYQVVMITTEQLEFCFEERDWEKESKGYYMFGVYHPYNK